MGDLPQIPSYDVGLGLASAVLLFLATYLLARARVEPGAEPRACTDSSTPPLFRSLRLEPSQRGLSFVGSLFAHLMLVAVVPSLQILSYELPPIEVPRYEIITLDYRMPLPPVVSADELDPPESVSAPAKPAIENEELAKAEEEAKRGNREGALSSPARAAAAPRPKEGGAASPDDPEAAPESTRERATVRVLLREKLQVNPALRDIVVQPDFKLELPRDYQVNLPPVMLWASSPLRLETGAVLEPVSRPDFSTASLPDLAPQVLLPNDEIALADLQIPAPAVAVEKPALTLPPADVVPLAGQNPLADIAPPPTSAGELGQNSLIVLSQHPDLQATRFDLQPGFRLGSIDSSAPSGMVGPQGEGAAQGAGPAQNQPSTVTGPGKGIGSGEAAAGDGAGDPNDGDKTGSPAGDGSSDLISSIRVSGEGGVKIIELQSSGQGGAGGAGEGRAGEGGAGLGEAGPGPGAGGDPNGDPKADGRLRPLPRSQYGIILVSNTRSDIPEANAVLTGTPIYTVYIDVPEAPRKWVLQYCVPRSPQPKEPKDSGGDVIHIRSAERVDPPHALRTEPLRLELPEKNSRAPRRVIVYAVVTEEGELENFRVIRGADPKTDEMVLANLRSWDFHPAFQRGEPVSVEAVFGIPLQ
jgi:hypothetical protein